MDRKPRLCQHLQTGHVPSAVVAAPRCVRHCDAGVFVAVILLLILGLGFLVLPRSARAETILPAYTLQAGPDLDSGDETTIRGSSFVLGPTTPGKWGVPVLGVGAQVSYSFMDSGLQVDGVGRTSVGLDTFMPVGWKAEIHRAFDAWSAVANITFIEKPDPDVDWTALDAKAVDIRIGAHEFDGPRGTLAHAFFPPSNGGATTGDLHFDTGDSWKIGFGGDMNSFDIFWTAAHEIGHSIGLAHTSVSNSLMNTKYTEAFSGPQSDDIAGAVTLYGLPQASLPEPSGLVLAALGLMSLLAVGRHRRIGRS